MCQEISKSLSHVESLPGFQTGVLCGLPDLWHPAWHASHNDIQKSAFDSPPHYTAEVNLRKKENEALAILAFPSLLKVITYFSVTQTQT